MSVLETMIGWLAPPICVACGVEGSSLCLSCSESEIIPFDARCFRCGALSKSHRTCKSCRGVGAPRSVWVTTSYDGAAKILLQKYKFEQQRVAANAISELMVETFLNSNSNQTLQSMDYLVIPVPTATSRVRERGFDHSKLLARQISRRLGAEYLNGLGRIGQTRQLGAKRSQRLTQPNNNYYARRNLTKERNILLIDDVVTTGSTLKAATTTLKSAGANRIDALVFAKRL